MTSLPFVVQPRRKSIIERIGSEDSGILEVERRGYLTSGEKAFVQQVQQLDGGTSEIIALSRRVARKHGFSMDRAYNIVLAIIAGIKDDDESFQSVCEQIEIEFSEELTSAVKEMSTVQIREELLMATCMLKYRVNQDIDMDEVTALHPDLITGLANLYRDEDRRSVEAFKAIENAESEKQISVEEAEKKPAKTKGSRSTTTTGDSSVDSQDVESSI